MSTSVAPALETSGGSSTSGTDPIDSMDLTSNDDGITLTDSSDLPTDMVLGGKSPSEPAEPRDDGRDPGGRFAKKDEAGPTDTVPPVTSPFKYRALGQTHEDLKATIDAAGNMSVPASEVPRIREALNALHVARQETFPTLERTKSENQQLQAELAQIRESRTLADQKADSLVSALSSVMNDPDDNSAIAKLWELRAHWPVLTARAEAEHYKALSTKPAPKAEAAPAAPQAPSSSMPSAEAAKQTTTEYLEQMRIDHTLAHVPASDWKQLEERYASTPFAFLRLATAQDAQQHGVPVGSVVFDTDALAADVQQHTKREAEKREAAKGAVALAADNSRRTAPSINAPPSPGGGHAPKARDTSPKTKQELEDWWNSDKL